MIIIIGLNTRINLGNNSRFFVIYFIFYSLFYLIYKVINLKDCPQAQIELQREIERIRHDSRYKSLFRTTSAR